MSKRIPLIGWIALANGILALIIAVIAFNRKPEVREHSRTIVKETASASGEEIRFRPGSEADTAPMLRDLSKSLRKTDSNLAGLDRKVKKLEEKLDKVNENLDYVAGFIKTVDPRQNRDDLKAPRRAGREAAVIASLRTISSTQEQYRARYGTYGTLDELSTANFIDPILGSGKKSGYDIRIWAYENEWTCTAVPQTTGETGTRGFYVDHSGVIRFTTDGSEPTQNSPALD
ncbi:MAG: hypothetical protein E3J72_08795 [Planctomycetota bacterium]|nr:MAG: hypothetical protein E3J72_08795 [Planctomycetota bacterium]